ncbi:MAG: hypothetical protein KJ880_01260 [Candidatus Omnitrophica bacterium]|nr:hypothetical protein [Candidatus Omnitrophota bacterium]MBU1870394.1 hypothetical protein [Candidatus Omnitrophota bacterium]
MEIKTDAYKREGMYLHLADGDFFDFSRENIQKLADEYWNDPSKLPPRVRENEYFKTCTVCPYKGQDVFCSAMKPLLPFLDKMEKFSSFDRVTAVYVRHEGLIHVAETAMQDALQYVTNMSIFEYCENAKQFRLYFRSVMPFMGLNEAAAITFLNIYWLNAGDREKVNSAARKMVSDITQTTSSCVKRLNLMCDSDAFMNAYVKTQIFAQVLTLNMNSVLQEYFKGAT